MQDEGNRITLESEMGDLVIRSSPFFSTSTEL